ncbi:PREDICTED: uncharacterized protein C6orf163 homolog [Habropoda laboriosa]|uniref:uncharacterized protein C6orf163 homolog n=1 Tax=Habropoda laboriosa TaxID=597456 RepID=UPI00083DB4B1|nr:PREDICTED: uncharacterized protein C6orf163 homolog [Habropoda laboriosa]
MHKTSPKCNIKLCSNNAVPPSSVVHACLGPSLAQIFFDYAHHDTIKLLDLLTSSKRSKACFSDTSYDHLRESTFLPPTDNQITKAFVHQNILEIGETILQRVKKQIEESLREKIERQSREKFYMYQAKKRREIELITQQMHEKYEEYIDVVREELEKQLEIEWSIVAAECAKNTQKAVVQERIKVVNEMMGKMRAEMTYVVQSLYKEFEESFCAQRDTIIADFNQIMRSKHVQLKKEMQEFEEKVSRELHVQKRQFEMQNTTDIIYVLCLERQRSNREKHTLHKYFQQQIKGFHDLIVRLDHVIAAIREEIVNCHAEKKLLEEQLSNVTKHFQKFIDFTFNAMPGQAEFLLPLELQRLINLNNNKEEKSKEAKN